MVPIRKKVNKKFFETWSSDMAYVLGFFAADGNMIKTRRGTHFLSFHSKDRDIMYAIRRSLDSDHMVSKRTSDTGSVYRLQIGSKKMFADLLRLGFVPGKTNRLSCPDIPKKFLGDFVRGYFDGDGNVWVGYVHKDRKTPTHVLQVAFTSGSRNFLVDLKQILTKEGLRGGSIYTARQKNFSRLQFSTVDSLQLADCMYNSDSKLYLKRKRLRFEHFKQTREC